MLLLAREVRPAGKPGAPAFPYLPVVARVSSTGCLATPREQAFESHHESHALSESRRSCFQGSRLIGACRPDNSETFQFLGMPLRGWLKFSVLPFQPTPH